MTAYYPIVIEMEASGAVSAYVPGRGCTRPLTRIRVARVSTQRANGSVVASLVGVGALLGTGRSTHKARASRSNGHLGGRPRRSGRKSAKTVRRA